MILKWTGANEMNVNEQIWAGAHVLLMVLLIVALSIGVDVNNKVQRNYHMLDHISDELKIEKERRKAVNEAMCVTKEDQ